MTPQSPLPGDTIVAVASAPPPAVRVVVRLSGPGAFRAAGSLLEEGAIEAPLGRGRLVLPALGRHGVPVGVYRFVGPRSYTGEDVVELHLPGSPWVVAEVMGRLLACEGVRHAEAGEFTARAYLGGKLDLTAAEGVAAVIAASDARELRAARQLMAGDLAAAVNGLTERLAQLLALLEAGIDFTDQDVSFISRADLRDGIDAVLGDVRRLMCESSRVRTALSDGGVPGVLLLGRPNAGKSTLVNALLGRPRAVTSPQAGTTRDVLYAELELANGRVKIADSAGIEPAARGAMEDEAGEREEGGVSGKMKGEIAGEMRRRALAEGARADVLVLVRDVTDVEPLDVAALLPAGRAADLQVTTKIDRVRPGATTAAGGTGRGGESGSGGVAVSAHTGEGLGELREALDRLCFAREGGSRFALTARHVFHLSAAATALEQAGGLTGVGGDELIASSLRVALDELGAIVGVVTPDDVLGRVFATFCIGK